MIVLFHDGPMLEYMALYGMELLDGQEAPFPCFELDRRREAWDRTIPNLYLTMKEHDDSIVGTEPSCSPYLFTTLGAVETSRMELDFSHSTTFSTLTLNL